jgi:hypothetical protein
VLAAAGAMVFTAPAGAAVSVTSFTVAPASTQAGGSPDVTVGVTFASPGADTLKDATLSLPPGLLANPSAPMVCTAAAFQAETCPASSQIGDGTITATAATFGTTLRLPVGFFLLTPQSSAELARIGVIANFDDFPVASISAPVRLRTSSGTGLDISLNDIPNQVSGIGAQINELSMRLYGTVNGGHFIRMPTSCAAADTHLTIDSYGSPATQVPADASFTPTGCAALAYAPHLAAQVSPDTGDNGAAFDASITQTGAEAATKDVTLTLPSGLSPRLSALSSACGAGDVSTCPAVGTATVTTPLLPQPVQGKLVLAANTSGLPSLDAVFPPPFALTLKGTPSVSSGGVQATFGDIPDFPITKLQVHLNGGSGSLLTAGPDLCSQTQSAVGLLTAHSGATAHLSEAATVQGCSGPGGGASTPKLLKAKLSGLASGHPSLHLSLVNVSSFSIALPSGLSFKLHSHKGLSIVGAKLKVVKLSHGSLVVTLTKQAGSVSVTVMGPLLNESASLKRKVRHHKIRSLTLRLRLNGGAVLSRTLRF